MARRAVVIGGAGAVGAGVAGALREAGWEVCVVDPAGGDVAERARPGLASKVGPCDLAVLSLPARGQARPAGSFRPSEVAAAELPARLAALELATAVLDEGTLIELAGGVALDPGPDEAGLIAGWQRGIHRALVVGRVILCALPFPVDPEDDGPRRVGERLIEIAGARRGGTCRLEGPDGPVEWMD